MKSLQMSIFQSSPGVRYRIVTAVSLGWWQGAGSES